MATELPDVVLLEEGVDLVGPGSGTDAFGENAVSPVLFLCVHEFEGLLDALLGGLLVCMSAEVRREMYGEGVVVCVGDHQRCDEDENDEIEDEDVH